MTMRGISETITRQDWLEPVETGLQKAVSATFESAGEAGQKTQNFLHGTWIGHPLHVILTDIPLGAWSAAMVFDAIDAATDNDGFRSAADACIGFGLVGALGAAVTGLTDWHQIDPPARRVGLVHGLLNLAGTALFTASFFKRRAGSRAAGRALSSAGYLVAALSAQLGGDLVYDQRIGVDHAPAQGLPKDFTRVLAESELHDDVPMRAEHNGLPILLVKRGDHIFALAETCSHLGGPLSEGRLEGNTIQCPWHGSQFSLEDGSVVNGPAVHPQPCLEARILDGQIEVRSSRRDREIESSDVTSSPEMSDRLPKTGTSE
jgi:nitrite reductase/ring-hydroxylating ferredoxin subunit/uncharacterized membrane protein